MTTNNVIILNDLARRNLARRKRQSVFATNPQFLNVLKLIRRKTKIKELIEYKPEDELSEFVWVTDNAPFV